MEYKLNKVDYEVRERIRESTSIEKVHGNKETYKVRSDMNDKNKQEQKKFKLPEEKTKKSKIVIVETNNEETSSDGDKSPIIVNAFKEDEGYKLEGKGNILDIRK